MAVKQEKIIKTSLIPFGSFFLLAPYCVCGAAYLFGLFLVQRTFLAFFILTAIYGAWLVIYHLGRWSERPLWYLALFSLACCSFFVPLPSANSYWLPMLSSLTACVMVGVKPRWLALLSIGILWGGASLALSLLAGYLDIGSMVILLISFGSTCGCTEMICQLAVAHEQLQKYSVQAEAFSAVRERNRIAREIHDTLGHSLTLLAVQLETATQLEAHGDARLREELLAAREVAKACLTDVRHSVQALRLDESAGDSLQEQLRSLAVAFETSCHETSIVLDLEEETLPSLHPELRHALYRCAQEALTNVRKHAHATKVLLRLSLCGEQEKQIELTILDNGQGATSFQCDHEAGFGLLGMRERVELLHGTLSTGPERNGWRVEAIFPLSAYSSIKDLSVYTYKYREMV